MIEKENVPTSQSSAYPTNQKEDWRQRPDLSRCRERIRVEIQALLESRKPKAPSTIRSKLPALSQRLENVLFQKAESEREHLDTKTLNERLRHLKCMRQDSLLGKEKRTDCKEEIQHVEYVYKRLQSWRAHIVEEQNVEPHEVLENSQLANISELAIKAGDVSNCGLPTSKLRAYGHSLREIIRGALKQLNKKTDSVPLSFFSTEEDCCVLPQENPALDTSYDVSAAVLASLRSVADRTALKCTPVGKKDEEAIFDTNTLKKRRKLASCVTTESSRDASLLPKETIVETVTSTKQPSLHHNTTSSVPSDHKTVRDAALPTLLPTVKFNLARNTSSVRSTSHVPNATSQRMYSTVEPIHTLNRATHTTSAPYSTAENHEHINPSLLQVSRPTKSIEMYEIENQNLRRLLQQTMHEKYELEMKVSRLTQQLLESTAHQ